MSSSPPIVGFLAEDCYNQGPGVVSCSSWRRPLYDKPTSRTKINNFFYGPAPPPLSSRRTGHYTSRMLKELVSVSFRPPFLLGGDEESRKCLISKAGFLASLGMTTL